MDDVKSSRKNVTSLSPTYYICENCKKSFYWWQMALFNLKKYCIDTCYWDMVNLDKRKEQ